MEREHNSENQPIFLILGAPNAGKTTLMYRLYSGIFYNTVQVTNQNVETVKVDKVRLRALNILENKLVKEIREPLTIGTSGVIFIVDTSISAEENEVHSFFQEIISSTALKNLPLLIIGNKADLPHYDELQLMKYLRLTETQQKERFLIQLVSCRTTEGIIDGMQWLMKKTNQYFYIPAFRKLKQ